MQTVEDEVVGGPSRAVNAVEAEINDFVVEDDDADFDVRTSGKGKRAKEVTIRVSDSNSCFCSSVLIPTGLTGIVKESSTGDGACASANQAECVPLFMAKAHLANGLELQITGKRDRLDIVYTVTPTMADTMKEVMKKVSQAQS